MQDMYTTFHGV